MARETAPVVDWASDFDVLDPGYIADPFGIWEELRQSCPVPHSNRKRSKWMPLRYEDVTAIAHDIEHFSSIDVGVVDEDSGSGEPDEIVLPYGLAPISVDPPVHTWTRRLLLPWFSHKRVDAYEPLTRDICRRMLDAFAGRTSADAAVEYAQQIPVRVVAHILGVSPDMSDTFTEWVRGVLEFADDAERSQSAGLGILNYFISEVAARRQHPGDDLLSELLHKEVDGAMLDDGVVLGMASLVLIAGVDTTWSAIGSSLWHLATHASDRRRLVEEPELMSVAVEELLRAYSPVTMARMVASDVEFRGCPMKAGDKVLLNFPAANRDPEIFKDADRVVLDRPHNRHVAFGSGIHRCAGSNLARMELTVALEEWLARVPEFTLAEGAEVVWAGGQVRGPRVLPVVFG